MTPRRHYTDALTDPDEQPTQAEADPGPPHTPDGCDWCEATDAALAEGRRP